MFLPKLDSYSHFRYLKLPPEPDGVDETLITVFRPDTEPKPQDHLPLLSSFEMWLKQPLVNPNNYPPDAANIETRSFKSALVATREKGKEIRMTRKNTKPLVRSSQSEITRREFIERLASSGLALIVAGQLANGVTAKEHGNASVRVGLNGANTSDGLDPALPQDVFMANLSTSFRDRLFELDEEGRPVGTLAEEWEFATNADRLRIRIRRGVQFHNGRGLKASDVIASINHHRGPDSKSALKVLMDQIEDIRADGNYVVDIQLREGNADFVYYLGSYDTVIGPESKQGNVDWNSGIGTGAYILEYFEPGIGAGLLKNKNYFDPNRGLANSVEFLAINDNFARVSALRTGSVDLISYVPPRIAEKLHGVPRVTLVQVPSSLHYTLPMDTSIAPFDNNDVRTALKFAIDRESILKKVLNGFGHLGNDHPIASTQAYYAELPQRSFDPGQAQFYLKKSGVGKLRVNLHVSDAVYAGATDTALLYAESARQAGIDIQVKKEPQDGYWSRIWMKKPFCFSWSGGRPTADWMFSQHYASNAAYNETRWKNPRFNELLRLARRTTNESVRSEMYAEMQKLVRDHGGALIPVFANHLIAHSTRVKLPARKLGGIWTLDNYRLVTEISVA